MSHPDNCEFCGTVSHGTLRAEDLIPAFAEALAIRLEELAAEKGSRRRARSTQLEGAREQLGEIEGRMEDPEYFDSEDADEDLAWLEEQLGLYAPPGHWFGAHPGDGSDFGFWPLDLLEGGAEGDGEALGEEDEGDGRTGGAHGSGATGDTPRRSAPAAGNSFPALDETHVETWFERDRAHVALYDSRSNALIAEWWDDDVAQAVTDGFFDPRDYHGSAYEYARHLADAESRP